MIERLCWMLSDLKNRDKEVVLVSSGAIGVGSKSLGFKKRPKLTREKQAAAAVGQAILMQIYQNFFNTYTQTVAQILLTKTDFEHGVRRTNTENTSSKIPALQPTAITICALCNISPFFTRRFRSSCVSPQMNAASKEFITYQTKRRKTSPPQKPST